MRELTVFFCLQSWKRASNSKQDQSSMMLLFEHNFRHNAVVSFVVLRVTLQSIMLKFSSIMY